MLRDLTSRQVSEWIAFYSIEPWGYWDSWQRNSRLCAVMSNPYRKRNTRALETKDFMPKPPHQAAEKPQTTAEQIEQVKRITILFGGKIRKRGSEA
jgi:hypothetical protein